MKFENRLRMDNGSRNKMTVDGKDCRISEQKPFWGGWKSHKFNGPELSYEVGVVIQSGDICWINGPFPAGSYHDITIFRQRLKHKLAYEAPGEKVEADNGYRGEPFFIDTPNVLHSGTVEEKEMKTVARSRHETVNRRLTHFNVLYKKYRHHISKHQMCFYAVATICQVSIENGSPLFPIKYKTYELPRDLGEELESSE